jgi:hypothetical protein
MIVERLILQTIGVLHQIPKAGVGQIIPGICLLQPRWVGQMIPGIGGSDHCRNRWVKPFPECLSQMIPDRVGQILPVQSIKIRELLTKKVSYSAIGRILGVHRLTLSEFVLRVKFNVAVDPMNRASNFVMLLPKARPLRQVLSICFSRKSRIRLLFDTS